MRQCPLKHKECPLKRQLVGRVVRSLEIRVTKAKNRQKNGSAEESRVGSPFNEDSKNIIFGQGGPNFEAGTAGKFWENGHKQENLLSRKLGSGQF